MPDVLGILAEILSAIKYPLGMLLALFILWLQDKLRNMAARDEPREPIVVRSYIKKVPGGTIETM